MLTITWNAVIALFLWYCFWNKTMYEVFYDTYTSLVYGCGIAHLLLFIVRNIVELIKSLRLQTRKRPCVAGQCVICWEENRTDVAPWHRDCKALVCLECEKKWLQQSVSCPVCRK